MKCLLRYLALLTALNLLLPASRADDKPLRQVIDGEIRQAWVREKITPAPPADDAAFLRRVSLDLIGTIPTASEVDAFLADTDANKRTKLIDRLLADPCFARHQANVWDLVLFGRNPPNGEATRKREGFKKWLAGKFEKNEPADRWVESILRAEEDGSQLFYVQFRNQPEETTVAVSKIFLGIQLQCARCHDHPYESWTQRDFYGMAAFFARLVVVDGGGPTDARKFMIGEKTVGDVLFSGPAVDQKPGKKGEPIKPKFLAGAALEEPEVPKDFKEPTLPAGKMPPRPPFSRKDKVANWVVAADNPYFARALANRVWGQFLGRGLVNPIDDLSDKHPPSHPELFTRLAEELKAHRYDLKWFIRELVNSEAYQLSARGSVSEANPFWFERARVRPLSAEELLASFLVATTLEPSKPGEERNPSGINDYLVRTFGEPTDGRGDFQGSLSEHLFLNNSTHLRQLITARKGNLADKILTSKASPGEKVDQLYLSILNRRPNPAERQRFTEHLQSGAKPELLVEEAIWVLLNTSEFRFNH